MKAFRVFMCDAGEFGTAMAIVAASAGNDVTLLIQPYDQGQEDLIYNLRNGTQQTNYLHLPGVMLPRMEFTDNFEAAKSADVICLAVPTKYIGQAFLKIKECLEINPKAILVLLSKGFDSFGDVPWGVMLYNNSEFFGYKNFAVMSGPTFAREIVKPYQAHFISCASKNIGVIKKLKALFKNSDLHLVGTTDLIGVSLGGCLKNACAPGYGLLEKLASPEAAFEYIWLALDEMKTFLNSAGANPKTLHSPAVERDFYVTCRGESRNKKFGHELAKYLSRDAIEAYTKSNTIEGYESIKTLWRIAQKNSLDTPFLHSIHAICEYGASPDTFVDCFNRVKALSG
ncbi:hypothetical protein A2926_03810 [Candidatus Giovannonibacteria bacterium RIFCSPLOWO2_01_FULL_44_40]|uniref:Glycerol-3-phosphate dehydrogenase n=1 Tax=Candidatus Giovannonibacteria bacterium RIFCSPHIGHO2_01_FULL_45_23 TaxID=1798325 RepID=A0A1F5VID8_9BACT|nr:MAG: hypothetical protein A2834_03735 [Candidatus Giovannonibacteria bacterium RIFCSPHIGHO2_01_FULL_45_23]OGF75839.1 MAG: hypothetical protein A3C77_04635 [Candidatus Giovannonibacteria bacterium RIFCSPHIGHO2_02_FULL_45_13]OGF80260.1 MAG: hypothetical protein A2926_03810 [Candidatus Giovannonibacteria bacterium RIFCSPLOWO2_01_FULL_44_40]